MAGSLGGAIDALEKAAAALASAKAERDAAKKSYESIDRYLSELKAQARNGDVDSLLGLIDSIEANDKDATARTQKADNDYNTALRQFFDALAEFQRQISLIVSP